MSPYFTYLKLSKNLQSSFLAWHFFLESLYGKIKIGGVEKPNTERARARSTQTERPSYEKK